MTDYDVPDEQHVTRSRVAVSGIPDLQRDDKFSPDIRFSAVTDNALAKGQHKNTKNHKVQNG